MQLRFTIRQLEYFVAVGEQGSIAQASAMVNVSSPSISAAITQLEAEFGLPLFVRKHAHGLSLTQAGAQFLAQARKVLAEAEGLNRLAGTISGNVQGPLTVGCLLTFVQVLLPAIRRKFQEANPEVQVSQIECDQVTLIKKLQRAEIDVALTYDLEVPADLEFIPVRSLPLYAVVSAYHPLADRKSVSVETLADHPMVLLDLPISSTYFLSIFEKASLRPNIVERTRDMAVMRSLVANGFGFSVANIRPHSDLSPDGRELRFIPLEGAHRPMRLGFIVPEGARSVLSINAFIEHASQSISAWGYPGLPIKEET
ncbi:LysR family transcriptional regulator [Sulfitobacter donghicola]|uniref:LysR family transcriptional regulator n=1 Tax=Sulfitobacter donghicola DSW-25 = KCTC 12864 = JCM 14565 TaxID=1300350 RepID=A0A073IV10_9RHOB|nr:LysR family transcriptional regulator [Sulfitobacter donghicola]KEJ89227.1 LysR family transcriptional regulator [Sulfitobacter donghicola DSW-25 = KCTC 12864 = JCM 14565]KIN69021.1 Transcriptional regulator, LysR family [Sulfitobacter donghicola DSW-25 = KCTC 12864 = JCM 14565]